ncbi:MAG: alpha/beta fold hydrolase [Flavobacteriales bacterium]|jgi:dipeptidyl aminopeptidase/acylaminoacyl peptidase|nr:alpha/beta fold hydrolase [Flavobacteriales bacterium]
MKRFFLGSLLLLWAGCQTPAPKKIVQYDIDLFFQNTSIRGGYFSSDENKLAYTSDASGIYNIYEVDLSSGETNQRTQSEKESFYVLGYIPNSNALLYSADKGGNEISHLYLLKEDNTTLDLTPQVDEKARFFGWSKDRSHFYYQSNKRDSRYFDLYKMKVGQWNPILVYENRQNLSLQTLSNNERYFLLSKALTTSTNDFFLFDNKTQGITKISETSGGYSSAGFSDDNTQFFYRTDVGKEFDYLKSYTIETGEQKIVYESDWDVMYSYLSENETYRVVGINEDGKTNLVIFNTQDGTQVDFPEIPDGTITGVSISQSEQKMRLSVGSSKSPNDFYLYDLKTNTIKKLTNSLNPELNADHLVAAEVIRFASFDGLEIPAIYYKPIQASAKEKVPALVWVHGGPGGQSRVGYSSLIQYLVNQGYAILAVNNRGSSGYGKSFYKMDDRNHGDKDLKDCIWGKKWLQEQDYIDPDKIGIIGGSYGGYMTMAAMAFAPDEFKVGVNIFGVTNWIRTLKSIPPFWEASRKALYQELGDPYTEDSIRLKAISPLFHAEKIKNPVMVLQGANDPRVLQVESDEIVAAVQENKVPVDYVIFPDEGHGFRKKDNQIKGYGQIKQFLDTYLKKLDWEVNSDLD